MAVPPAAANFRSFGRIRPGPAAADVGNGRGLYGVAMLATTGRTATETGDAHSLGPQSVSFSAWAAVARGSLSPSRMAINARARIGP